MASAPLKLWSRSDATERARDTVIVWALSGTDLVRRTCVNGSQTDLAVVATGIATFTPAACAAPCTIAVTVTFGAAGHERSDAQSWTLTVQPPGSDVVTRVGLDDGPAAAALIMAIVFVTVIGMVIAGGAQLLVGEPARHRRVCTRPLATVSTRPTRR